MTISTSPDPAVAGDELCITAIGTPGQGLPVITVSIDGGPSRPATTAEIQGDVATSCIDIPANATLVVVTVSQGSCFNQSTLIPS